MARSKKSNQAGGDAGGDEKEKGTRTMADYVFEDHQPDGKVDLIGLTMNYPSEAAKVQAFLENNRKALGITGTIRICKKIYS
jgi:hypothetical protein